MRPVEESGEESEAEPAAGPEADGEAGDAVRISERLAALGPHFAAESHAPEAGPPHAPWQSMGVLLEDADALAERVGALRAYLATIGGVPTESIETRVAASVMHLGLAARALSPLFALGVLGLRLPSPTPAGLGDLRWQPTLGSSFALSIADLAHAQPAAALDAVPGADIEAMAGELCEITRGFGVSPLILRGNVASALNGARIALSTAEPRLTTVAQAQLTRLLSLPSLAGTSRVAPGGRFQRRSCCLMYRAAPDRRGPLCGDCVLAGGAR